MNSYSNVHETAIIGSTAEENEWLFLDHQQRGAGCRFLQALLVTIMSTRNASRSGKSKETAFGRKGLSIAGLRRMQRRSEGPPWSPAFGRKRRLGARTDLHGLSSEGSLP